MKRTFIVLLGLLFMGLFANSAFAADPAARTGFIEVCKNSAPAPLAVIGNFRFQITDLAGNQTVDVPVGLCSAPIAVAPGTDTVTELGSLSGLTTAGALDPNPQTSFVKLAGVPTAVGPVGPITPTAVGTSGFSYSVPVTASASGSNGTVTITFTDQLVQGYVEVCKAIVTGSGLTGSWQFTITGGNGYTSTQTVSAGACSDPFLVPAGNLKVQETGDLAENVTVITATHPGAAGVATNAIVGGPNLATATVVVTVTPAPAVGDTSQQTIVTFTNDSVRLKVCKWVPAGTSTGPYTFNFTASGNSGPNTAPGPLTLPAGTQAAPNCQVVGTFRAGTTVGISEGPPYVAGTKVGAISVNPSGSQVGTADLPNGKTSVVLGPGETVVTYEDIPAADGSLKLCKVAGTLVTNGTPFTFSVSGTVHGATSPVSVTVLAGQCATVPGLWAYNSVATVVEAAAPHITVAAIAVSPAFVSVLEGGVPTNTAEPVTVPGSLNLATGTVQVMVGESNITEVTYTNNDPPDGSTGTGSTGTGTTGTGSTGTGSTGSTGGSTVSSTGGGSSSGGGSSTPATTSLPTLTTVPTSVGVGVVLGSSSTTSATAAAKAALLKADQLKAAKLKAAKLAKLNKQLATDKATLKVLVAKHAAAKTLAAKQHLAKQISTLKLSEGKLAKQIKQLK